MNILIQNDSNNKHAPNEWDYFADISVSGLIRAPSKMVLDKKDYAAIEKRRIFKTSFFF